MTTVEKILAHRIIAIIRLDEYARAVEIARALHKGGIQVLEFTLTGRGALEAIANVRKDMGDALCVGVGSALDVDESNAAIDAGAEFVVMPIVNPRVLHACVNRNTPVLAGGFTPTELWTAHEAGAELVKLFPAHLGGPGYVQAVLAPMPFLKLVPTGGVNAENLRAYLSAGAVAVGVGGNLISKQAVVSGAFQEITAAARALVQRSG